MRGARRVCVARRALAALVGGLVLWARVALAVEPCVTFTSTVPIPSLRPRTPLERLYYETSVCWRKRAEDAESATRSATISLAARTPEAIRAEAPPAVPETSSFTGGWIPIAVGAVLGVAACYWLCPKH